MKLTSLNPLVALIVAGMVVFPGALMGVPAVESDELFPEEPPDITVEPVEPESQYVDIETTDGTNELTIVVDDPGVNADAVTAFDDLIAITHADTTDQPVTVTVTQASDAFTFRDAAGAPVGDGMQLAPGETQRLGMSVDTDGIPTGTQLTATITITATFDPATTPEGVSVSVQSPAGTPATNVTARSTPVRELPATLTTATEPPTVTATATPSSIETGESVTLSAATSRVSSLTAAIGEEPGATPKLLSSQPVRVSASDTPVGAVRFTLSGARRGETPIEAVRIIHSPADSTEWRLLKTTVVDESDGQLTVEAPVTNLGLFAVIDESALTYAWSVQNATAAQGLTASQSFEQPGERTATVTITDATGQTRTASVPITVTAPEDTGNETGDDTPSSQPPQAQPPQPDPSPPDVTVDLRGTPAADDTTATGTSSVTVTELSPTAIDTVEAETVAQTASTSGVAAEIDATAAVTVNADVEPQVTELSVQDISTETAQQLSGTTVVNGGDTASQRLSAETVSIPDSATVDEVSVDQDAVSSDRPVTVVDQESTFSGEQSTIQSTDGVVQSTAQVGRAVDIEPAGEADAGGEVSIGVRRETIASVDPEAVTVGHLTDSGWELLETDVTVRKETVVASAQADDFSPFAVFVDTGVTYEWTFPDGTTQTGKSVAHAFEEPGVYPVELRITDARGQTATDTREVVVNDVPTAAPAVIDSSDSDDAANSTPQFVAVVDNEVGNTTVTWEFPDGATATGPVVRHDLPPGQHDVVVRVVDEYGVATTTTATVTVGPDVPVVGNVAAGWSMTIPAILSVLGVMGLVGGYQRVSWRSLGRRFRDNPRIIKCADLLVDPVGNHVEIGMLQVVDDDRPLESITIQLIETGPNSQQVRLETEIGLLNESRREPVTLTYQAEPEQILVPPSVTLHADRGYQARVIAENDHGQTAHDRTEQVAIEENKIN